MWKYCGVVKNNSNLEIGLNKLNNLKDEIKYLNIKELKKVQTHWWNILI